MYYPKQAAQTFMFFDVPTANQFWIDDTEWCLLPSTDDKFDSRCEEILYTDISVFYNTLLGGAEYDGPSFGYVSLCVNLSQQVSDEVLCSHTLFFSIILKHSLIYATEESYQATSSAFSIFMWVGVVVLRQRFVLRIALQVNLVPRKYSLNRQERFAEQPVMRRLV